MLFDIPNLVLVRSSALDRTLPFLDIDTAVVNDDIVGTGFCSHCGGTPLELVVAEKTTEENINLLMF